MARIIFAFNGDLESRLALHWLAHEGGHEIVALSLDLGQEVYLEPLGELALELGASKSLILDRRADFLQSFALPAMQAGAVYQGGCFLGSALARYAIAQELVRVAREEGSRQVAHAAAHRGNDRVRMEAALAALDPNLTVLSPVREWGLHTLEEKLNYARRRRLPIDEPTPRCAVVDRNLWGVSLTLPELLDSWEEPPPNIFILTRAIQETPSDPVSLTLEFDQGLPVSVDGRRLALLPLVRELNQIGGLHGIGRRDVIEDRLFGIKSRELYETPAGTLLMTAHGDLETLVQSRELLQVKKELARRYAELVYSGHWFHDLRLALQGFFAPTQRYVTGEVRLQLHRGTCRVLGRRSPHSLYDGRLTSQSNQELFTGSELAQGITSLWTLPARLAGRRRSSEPPPTGGRDTP